jgi:hypothetical protein
MVRSLTGSNLAEVRSCLVRLDWGLIIACVSVPIIFGPKNHHRSLIIAHVSVPMIAVPRILGPRNPGSS